MSPRFSRRKDGSGLELELSREEYELLGSLPGQLRDLYESSGDDDPVRNRLFPRAYLDPTAEEAEQEWRDLVHPELLPRLAALDQLTTSLDGAEMKGRHGSGGVVATLSDDDVAAWLAVLNDARLALGTRLEVTDDLDVESVEPEDPRAPGFAAYSYLTYLQGSLIELLLDDLPE